MQVNVGIECKAAEKRFLVEHFSQIESCGRDLSFYALSMRVEVGKSGIHIHITQGGEDVAVESYFAERTMSRAVEAHFLCSFKHRAHIGFWRRKGADERKGIAGMSRHVELRHIECQFTARGIVVGSSAYSYVDVSIAACQCQLVDLHILRIARGMKRKFKWAVERAQLRHKSRQIAWCDACTVDSQCYRLLLDGLRQ